MTPTARSILTSRLTEDLLGPGDPDEMLSDRPSDRYLTGILYPQGQEYGPEEDEELATSDDETESAGDSEEEAPPGLAHAMRPASAGISFAVQADGTAPELLLTISCGTYTAVEHSLEKGEENPVASAEGRGGRRSKVWWQRCRHEVELPLILSSARRETPLDESGLPGMKLFMKLAEWDGGTLVTLALVNSWRVEADDQRRDREEKTFFQTRLKVRPGKFTRILPRPAVSDTHGTEAAAAALIYRNARQFAVGHTCSASWESVDGEKAESVSTEWLPKAFVSRTSSEGALEFRLLKARDDGLNPLSAEWLSRADEEELIAGLNLLTEAYRKWIMSQEARIPGLPAELLTQAASHLSICGTVEEGIRGGIEMIRSDSAARTAFCLANKAMLIQRSWLYPEELGFSWRPFQLAFVLLSLPSLADPLHPDRDMMDLLWFPTGGGKTEAYLSLIAFTIFHRRLRNPGNPDAGAGVAVIMRYTLRLLTAQQFQRACALILACEYLRQSLRTEDPISSDLGRRPFSIGLWVGDDATANEVADAIRALEEHASNSPAQIESCPACGERLRWQPSSDARQIRVACDNKSCPAGAMDGDLPVWTVDEDVYREVPSLVIGTVDKFAQIVRKTETARLFGIGTEFPPPELIIQDELHLITGPLGTLAGIYEAAIDELCARGNGRPKLIGSTATIRRAEPQVRALFDRRTRQFPPLGIDSDNSGFAVVDEEAPGRLYIGLTTAGRSAKFTLQAAGASLLQSAKAGEIPDQERDGYWTLVAYFNSLRELGGALVLMRDDVGQTIRELASRRGDDERDVSIVEELTSRRTQLEIRDKLEELGREWPDAGTVDVLLATNMISVGVDIPRLGLMIVNGQPKAIAEYIQATSRVGRSDAPGLIVSVFNSAKARDRSHYETFATWHTTLYREVEASSVTPFASRARDRALHAPLVALIRHMVPGMSAKPSLSAQAEQAARRFAERLVRRAERIDPEESPSVARQLESIIEEWKDREPLKSYWNDRRVNTSLLISAETAAALRAAGRLPGSAWSTPNSLRNVDPGTPFVLAEKLRVEDPEEES